MIDRSKIGRKSKRKGRKYESRVAHLLTEFTGVNFRRVPASGGFNKTGGVVVAQHVFSGDVICDDHRFLFSVEAKNRKDMSLTALLKSPTTAMFTKCWDQCLEDAKTNNCKPMMFFKPNMSDDWVCLREQEIDSVTLCEMRHIKLNVYTESSQTPNPVIIDWNEFTKHVNANTLFKETTNTPPLVKL